MKRLKTSIVAWSCAAALASFGILYRIVPYERMLDLSLSLALGAAFATVARYLMDAIRSVREGRAGANFLIAAVFSIAVVILAQRIWGIVLRVYDRPDWLIDSSMTVFIPWMLAWSVSLAFIAPDVDDYNAGERKGVWRSLALFLGGAIAGFVLATSFTQKTAMDISRVSAWTHLANRPTCKDSEEVWVSSRGVYHTVESPYRGMVIPDRCYLTAKEAEAQGFRAPGKGLK